MSDLQLIACGILNKSVNFPKPLIRDPNSGINSSLPVMLL